VGSGANVVKGQRRSGGGECSERAEVEGRKEKAMEMLVDGIDRRLV
jgi:hypothetical protein